MIVDFTNKLFTEAEDDDEEEEEEDEDDEDEDDQSEDEDEANLAEMEEKRAQGKVRWVLSLQKLFLQLCCLFV